MNISRVTGVSQLSLSISLSFSLSLSLSLSFVLRSSFSLSTHFELFSCFLCLHSILISLACCSFIYLSLFVHLPSFTDYPLPSRNLVFHPSFSLSSLDPSLLSPFSHLFFISHPSRHFFPFSFFMPSLQYPIPFLTPFFPHPSLTFVSSLFYTHTCYHYSISFLTHSSLHVFPILAFPSSPPFPIFHPCRNHNNIQLSIFANYSPLTCLPPDGMSKNESG